MSWLPDPAVIRDADVFLIKDCFFPRKQLWGTLSSLQVGTIAGAPPAGKGLLWPAEDHWKGRLFFLSAARWVRTPLLELQP